LANLLWAPGHTLARPQDIGDLFSDVTLYEDKIAKRFDGFGAASKLNRVLAQVAQAHGV
jgi:hypothetical protein